MQVVLCSHRRRLGSRASKHYRTAGRRRPPRSAYGATSARQAAGGGVADVERWHQRLTSIATPAIASYRNPRDEPISVTIMTRGTSPTVAGSFPQPPSFHTSEPELPLALVPVNLLSF